MWHKLTSYIDSFLLLLLATIGIATLLPLPQADQANYAYLTSGAIALLFFLYGAKLKTRDALTALKDWKLHGTTLAFTFVLFPILGFGLTLLPSNLLPTALATGLLFMTLLPSTVQSSIAFTSLAGGNVPGAICAASFSNLLGIVATPLMVTLLMGSQTHMSGQAAIDIVLQLLAPFVAGQFAGPYIRTWLLTHPKLTRIVDRGSILLVVYGAFSQGITDGVWQRISPASIGIVMALNSLVLAIVLWLSWNIAKKAGFSRADAIVILFCGSKKSLATGVPMAKVLLPANVVGAAVVPLMLFHQLQLVVCAVIARKLSTVK